MLNQNVDINMMLFTKQGYGFFEVSSAIQKAIRRNDEEKALYFMVEMFNSGYDEYVWKRLKIITSEDVGLAEPNMPANIQALYEMYVDQKKKKADNRPERLFLVHAVTMLCRCNKSRLIDWYVIELWRKHESLPMQIPEYAYDMHTAKGKKAGKGLDNFYEESSHLENHIMQPKEAEVKISAKRWHEKFKDKLNFSFIKEVKVNG